MKVQLLAPKITQELILDDLLNSGINDDDKMREYMFVIATETYNLFKHLNLE